MRAALREPRSGTAGWAGRQLLITQRLRRRRGDLGLTQQQVVSRLERSGVHTSNRAVSSLEHGAGVDVAKLPELAAALDCTVTYLLGLTDYPHRWEPDHRSGEQHPPRKPAEISATDSAAVQGSWILGHDIPERALPLASTALAFAEPADAALAGSRT